MCGVCNENVLFCALYKHRKLPFQLYFISGAAYQEVKVKVHTTVFSSPKVSPTWSALYVSYMYILVYKVVKQQVDYANQHLTILVPIIVGH